MNHSAHKSLRSLVLALGTSAMLIPAVAFAGQPEINCMDLPEAAQQEFYDLSGQVAEALAADDLDSALVVSLQAMKYCTTDAFTEYNLARIYQIQNNCPAAYYHFERLNNRVKEIAKEDRDLSKAITKYYKEIQNTCGDVVDLEVTCATEGTKLLLAGAIDSAVSCPVYTKVRPGSYALTATRDKFFPHKDTLTVGEEGLVYEVPALKDAEDVGNVVVKCPRGAMKFILTNEKGEASEYACPWEGKLQSGTYKIKLGGSDAATESELVVSKNAQIEHVIPSEVKTNCSAATKTGSQGGIAALLMTLFGAFGCALLRRKREN